jgi:hypothetical protein
MACVTGTFEFVAQNDGSCELVTAGRRLRLSAVLFRSLYPTAACLYVMDAASVRQ